MFKTGCENKQLSDLCSKNAALKAGGGKIKKPPRQTGAAGK
jgi:hypothetical protein